MLKTRQLLLLFIPAIILVGFALFVRVTQYEPLYPKEAEDLTTPSASVFAVPVYPQDPVIGERGAKITLIAFADFGCESCKEQDNILDALVQKHSGKIRIVWKGLPVSHFPYDTRLAHHYAACAERQGKFTAFKQYAFANNDNLSPDVIKTIGKTIALNDGKLQQCLSSGLAESDVVRVEQTASLLNIQAVPTMFWNNKQINPPQTVEVWEGLLGL